MKKTFMCFIAFVLFLAPINVLVAQSKTIHSVVDERVELISIIFRLAGAPEYSKGGVPSYNEDVDTYFAEYKDHEAIKLAYEMGNNLGIRYDKVAAFAVRSQIVDSTLSVDESMTNLTSDVWTKERMELFATKVTDFYRDTNFKQFYDSHADIYAVTTTLMDDILYKKMNFNWFNEFYSQPASSDFRIVISMINGCGNYGAKTKFKDKTEDLYAIIGVCNVDSLGFPVFSVESTIHLLVHEISHSYCNHLVDKYFAELDKSGVAIFPLIKESMSRQAYATWKTVLCEALVRASTINYAQKDANIDEMRLVRTEMSNRFFWIEGLVEKLELYDTNRDKYPSLESYMPQIVAFYNELAYKINNSPLPKVGFSSIENNSNIDSSTTELLLTFNKPMKPKGPGFNNGEPKKEIPGMRGKKWVDDKTLKIELKLEKNKEYSFRLFLPAFLDTEGLPVLDDFVLSFDTLER